MINIYYFKFQNSFLTIFNQNERVLDKLKVNLIRNEKRYVEKRKSICEKKIDGLGQHKLFIIGGKDFDVGELNGPNFLILFLKKINKLTYK